MSNQMPDSITRVLLAALNAAEEVGEGDLESAEPLATEIVTAAKAVTGLARMRSPEVADDRQNRFVATIRLSMDKFKSAS